jgi:hypothetical protein
VQREPGGITKIFHSFYRVYPDDLEIECRRPAGPDATRIEFNCPVVARMAWSFGLVMLLAFGALVGWAISQLQAIVGNWWTKGVLPWDNWEDWVWALQSRPGTWLWPLALAILSPLLALGQHLWTLRQRRNELEARHRQRWMPGRSA